MNGLEIKSIRLSELKEGQKGIITKVLGKGSFRKRLIEMGFVQGKEVELIKFAPLKDPIEFKIMGYLVSLRRSEASLIEILTSDILLEQQNFNFDKKSNIFETIRNQAKEKTNTINVALVGNPNCGKTTLFNFLTGSYEHVGNYSGVTVDAKIGKTKYRKFNINIIDLPGTYSLTALTPEELYVRKYILNEMPDIIINVVEAPNIERNMFLTTQLIDMDIKMIVALNMFDEFENQGNKLDIDTLSELLGCPIVTTIASKNIGTKNLLDKIVDTYSEIEPTLRHIHINYGKEIENCIDEIEIVIRQPFNKWLSDSISVRFLSIKLLELDNHAIEMTSKCLNSKKILEKAAKMRDKLVFNLKQDVETLFANARYGFINGALRETFVEGNFDRFYKSNRIDKILTNKYIGIPIFLFFLYLTFFATFNLGEYPMMAIEWLFEQLQKFVSISMHSGILKDLLSDGIISGVGNVAVFLPNIIILFFFISLMEDTGYMARVAFIMDKIMHKIGLHGKSFIPLLMGFGCNVPAIMSTRTIENKNERLLTILINPFMSCSARLPVYMVIIAAIFEKYRSLALFAIYLIGIVVAIGIALLFRKTIFRKKESPFVMEQPPYRIPTFRATSKHIWHKSRSYLKKMTNVILLASIIVWALGYFPQNKKIENQYISKIQNNNLLYDSLIVNNSNFEASFNKKRDSINFALKSQLMSQKSMNSYIGKIGKFFEPIMRPLGFDWKITVSLIAATPAKEIAVSTLAILYQSPNESSLSQNIKNAVYEQGKNKGKRIFSIPVAAAFLVFTLLYFPCIATIATIKQETDSWGWTAFAIIYSTIVAYLAAFIIKIALNVII